MTLTNETKVKQKKSVTAKTIDSQIYLFDDTSGNLYSLNETAGEIWQCMRTSTTIQKIIKHQVQLFNVSESIARKDTIEIIKFFLVHGFIIRG